MTELELTLGWIARAVNGRLIGGDPDQRVGDITTDSRGAKSGDFFVALRGPRFDGHQFVAEVLARGAVGAMVDAQSGTTKGDLRVGADARGGERGGPGNVEAGLQAGLIEVADTLQGLQALAHAIRKAVTTQVIAITGSAGKTTTKETIADFLSGRFTVVKNKGNLNNHIGLPLSLMQLRTRPDVAVMELGMNHAGEISTLVAIAEPDVRVWTNVGDAHLGFFASADAIADAKAEILEGAGADTVLVANADDARVMQRVATFGGRTLTFGAADGATVQATEVEDLGVRGMRARVVTPAGALAIATPLLGRGNLSNVLAAIAVALQFGVPLDAIAERAAQLHPADRRGAVQRRRDITIIDDSYNSSPRALQTALDVVAHEGSAARRVAVLGEMLELGDHSIALHQECGAAAARAALALLVTVGGAPAKAMAEAAIAGGMAPDAVIHFDASDKAADAIGALVRAGDLVLVKGSRGTRTDIVADRLAAEFA